MTASWRRSDRDSSPASTLARARFPGSFLLVTSDALGLTGFVAVAESTGRLYREFLLRDGLVAGLAAAPAVLRAQQVWETLRYGVGSADADLPAAEILAIAVAAARPAAGHGSGPHGRGRRRAPRPGRGLRPSRHELGQLSGHQDVRAGRFPPRHSRTEVHGGEAQEVMVWR